MLGRTVLAASVAVALATAAARVDADVPPVRLALVHARGAEGCLDRATLAQDVAARLRRDPFADDALRSIEVVLTHESDSWQARIYARDTPASTAATRTLDFANGTCDRIEASVALAVALAIDPDAPLAEPPPASPSPSPPPASSSPPASPAPAAAPTAAVRRDSTAWDRTERFGLRALASLGTAPSIAPGIGLTVDTRRSGPFRATVGALRTGEVLTADSSFGFSLTALWAAVCVGTANASVGVSGCAGVEGGVVTGVVHRVETLRPVNPGDQPWLALTLPGRFTVRITDIVSAELAIEPFVTLIRQQFLVQHGSAGTAPVFEQSPVGLNGYLGLSARFF